jgi:hypothetical protein
MVKGLFINNKKAKDSIYESGYMVYQCLMLSNKYSLDYIEIDETNRTMKTGYDFYLFNYHPSTMHWLDTKPLRKKLGFVMTIVLEVLPNDPFPLCPKNDFDTYIVLDPTINIKNKKVYAFPRPLEKIDFELPNIKNEIPVIGTFGFATKGKGFQHVVDAVNKEFDKAIVRINIPFGDFVPDSQKYAHFLADVCKQKAKEGIEVQVTHDFMSKKELIKWCASNTLNCFLYDRNMPGLAATTDQAIVSKRPLSISNNETFRHVIKYIQPYPNLSLRQTIATTEPIVNQIINDWSPENFAKKFEEVLIKNNNLIAKKHFYSASKEFILIIKKNNLLNTISQRIKKYKRKIKKANFTIILSHKNDSKHPKAII